MGNRNGAQRGPLRDIIETLEVGLKEKRMQNRYRLECGHEAWGNKSATRSRCQFCKEIDIKSGGIVPVSTKKKCNNCGVEKPLSEFNKNKRYKDGYVTWCKACYANYREARAKDPEKKAQDKARTDQWYWDNREEKKAKNNARSRERWHNDQEYRDRKNQQKKDAHRAKYGVDPKYTAWYKKQGRKLRRIRRMRMLNVVGSHTPQEFEELCQKYNYRCLRCGTQTTDLAEDHIVPVGNTEKQGTDYISNIQPLCQPCNSKKHTKVMDFRPFWDGNKKLPPEKIVEQIKKVFGFKK